MIKEFSKSQLYENYHIKKSKITNLLFNQIMKTNGIKFEFAYILYKIYCRIFGGCVEYGLSKSKIILPALHPLPIYQKNHPHYDTLLPRLLEVTRAYIGCGVEVVVVDVGANVGDTAIPLLEHDGVFVIAVDGNHEFLPYLSCNLAPFAGRVHIARCYVEGSPGKSVVAETAHGTARLVSAPEGQGISSLSTLQGIVDGAGKQDVHILKVDTDGFDIAILENSKIFLAEKKPAILFEFDPSVFIEISPEGWKIFDILHSLGYSYGIAYANDGNQKFFFELDSDELINKIQTSIKSHGISYLDILVMTSAEMYARFATSERSHFGATR